MREHIPCQDLGIIDLLPDPVVILDTEGAIQWCNDATLNLTQVGREELIGQGFTTIPSLQLDDIPKYVKVFASILKGNNVDPFRVTWDKKDGSSQKSDVQISCFRTPDGKKAVLVVARNITSQDEIRKAYRLMQYGIDNVSDPIIWFDDTARFLYANIAACKALQYSREELMDMTVHDVDFHYSKERWPSFLQELKARMGLTIESSLISKNKRQFPVEIIIQRLEFEDEILNFAYIKDLTNTRIAEQAIIQSEERNSIVVDSMSDLILIYDADFCLREYYTSDDSLLFLPWEEMEGKKVEDFMPVQYVDNHYENIRMAKETGGTASFEYELEVSGKSRWFQGTATIHPDNRRIVVAIKEITEKKLFEIALEKSEKRLQNLIEQLPLGVAIANLSEQIELANQAMADLLLQEKQKLLGSNLLDYIKPDSTDSMRMQTENRKLGKQSTYTIEMIRVDGVERNVRILAAPNYNDAGESIGSVGIFEDITEQKTNEAIRARQEQEISLYGSLLRHDLRNDLGLVISYIEAVQMLLQDPDDEVLGFMNSALASIERMTNLLKNFGRPQDVKEVDIVNFIKEISEEDQEAEKNLRISVAYAINTEPIRITTGSLLALVFMNLFRNSAQHAGTNPKIDVLVSKCDDWINIMVSDNGPGIEEDYLDRLFARGTSSKGEAGGLGLYLSKQIINGTGGSIELVKETQGATFQIQLPSEK